MCKVYNSVGSLKTVNNHLQQHHIDDFKSLHEIIAFQKNYSAHRQQIVSDQELLIIQEKNGLVIDIAQLESWIKSERTNVEHFLRAEIEQIKQKLNNLTTQTPAYIIQRIINFFKERYYKNKIQHQTLNLEANIDLSMQELNEMYAVRNNRYQYIVSQFKDAVHESCSIPLAELERKNKIINVVNTSIYGAVGELRVEEELRNLSDDYILINDLYLSLPTPLYNQRENDYIKSVQIDHILITPAGIFLIETKNWSKQSLDNLSLRSPVQQIKRTSFVLFKMLNDKIANGSLRLNRHHWGDRKIPIKNLIVFIHSKPNEEFQFVKVLTVSELLGYVKYFKPEFSKDETLEIASYLLNQFRHL